MLLACAARVKRDIVQARHLVAAKQWISLDRYQRTEGGISPHRNYPEAALEEGLLQDALSGNTPRAHR